MSERSRPWFDRYIGIDYSGASTPDKGLPGLRVFEARGDAAPAEVRPTNGGREHWSRRALAAWLANTLAKGPPALVGIDHGFSFPLAWFEQHGVAREWPAFLEDFGRHWPTDREGVTVAAVRRGEVGHGRQRLGKARWRRPAERRTRAAKSVFHFDVPGTVANSTHAGLPWLRHLRRELGPGVHWWPFDGWVAPRGCSVVAEVYPSLWGRAAGSEGLTPDQRDAFVAASAMQRASLEGYLREWMAPLPEAGERARARIEGWILGVR